jgi:hypothetical protein
VGGLGRGLSARSSDDLVNKLVGWRRIKGSHNGIVVGRKRDDAGILTPTDCVTCGEREVGR